MPKGADETHNSIPEKLCRVPLCVIHLIYWRIEFLSLNFYMYLSKEVLTRTSYWVTMFEDESRDPMKAVAVSDFYLFDAHFI